MKDSQSSHLKLQELCDCYSSTDPLKEMSDLSKETDIEEAALKWLALAALHGINANAKKIKISKSGTGDIAVEAEYREKELPPPGSTVCDAIFKKIREITHIDGEKGKTPLALGVRDSSLDLEIKIKEEDGKQSVTIKFPKE